MSTPLKRTDFYVPNCLETIRKHMVDIAEFRKEILQGLSEIDQKEHKELLESIQLQEKNLSTFENTLKELKAILDKDEKNAEARKKLGNLITELFELHRQFYRLSLDFRVLNVDRYFKVDKEVKRTREILDTLREVFHTIRIAIREFDPYFKYKTKGQGTDYRVPINWENFQEDSAAKAKESLLQHKGFRNQIGKEKVLIAAFPNLSQSEFNTLFEQVASFGNHGILHRIVCGKNTIIFFLKDFQSKTMDLHGSDLKLALEIAQVTLRERFLSFETTASLMCGKGNHSAGGKSVIQSALLKELKLWKSNNIFAIKKCILDPNNSGQILVLLYPPKPLSFSQDNMAAFEKAMTEAIQNQEQRIVVKLDQKYSPDALNKMTMLLIMGMVNKHSDIEVSLGEPPKTDADFIRFTVQYPNKNEQSFDQDFSDESTSASSTTTTSNAETKTESKVVQEQNTQTQRGQEQKKDQKTAPKQAADKPNPNPKPILHAYQAKSTTQASSHQANAQTNQAQNAQKKKRVWRKKVSQS